MIKLKKEDLMLMTKERLVELLMEYMEQEEELRDEIAKMGNGANPTYVPYYPYSPYNPYQTEPYRPLEVWYQKDGGTGGFPSCYSKDGVCTNPHHDCINCPWPYGRGGEYSYATTLEHIEKNLSTTTDSVSSKDNDSITVTCQACKEN